MKAKTILIIAALVAVAYFLYKKKSEENTNDTNNSGNTNDSDSSNSSSGSETPHVPVVTTKTTTERCPYCGTYGATVIRTYTDGVRTNVEVQCRSKSCPGKTANTGTSKKFENTSSVKLGSATGTKTNSAR